MHLSSKIGTFFLALVMTTSCYKKTTCPAFQSQYILDEKVLNRKYSLFDRDSIPKNGLGNVKKNKNGIHSGKSYAFKLNEIRSVDMETIYPGSQETVLVANYGADSLAMDSVMVPSQRYLTTFNNEQLIYNTLFGSLRKPQRDGTELFKDDLKSKPDEIEEEEEEKAGFFKRLFGGKNKKRKERKETESAEFGAPDEQEGIEGEQ